MGYLFMPLSRGIPPSPCVYRGVASFNSYKIESLIIWRDKHVARPALAVGVLNGVVSWRAAIRWVFPAWKNSWRRSKATA
jgi:hypothetical protein